MWTDTHQSYPTVRDVFSELNTGRTAHSAIGLSDGIRSEQLYSVWWILTSLLIAECHVDRHTPELPTVRDVFSELNTGRTAHSAIGLSDGIRAEQLYSVWWILTSLLIAKCHVSHVDRHTPELPTVRDVFSELNTGRTAHSAIGLSDGIRAEQLYSVWWILTSLLIAECHVDRHTPELPTVRDVFSELNTGRTAHSAIGLSDGIRAEQLYSVWWILTSLLIAECHVDRHTPELPTVRDVFSELNTGRTAHSAIGLSDGIRSEQLYSVWWILTSLLIAECHVDRHTAELSHCTRCLLRVEYWEDSILRHRLI
ncbi:hypothetical protein J6590_013765 [Homalodisca vitripennis]|nr:hypothetical protein J6590_013765 [Homalodisca vitripennis]